MIMGILGEIKGETKGEKKWLSLTKMVIVPPKWSNLSKNGNRASKKYGTSKNDEYGGSRERKKYGPSRWNQGVAGQGSRGCDLNSGIKWVILRRTSLQQLDFW